MYYIGTGNKYIATKSDGYMFVTEDLTKARRYSTAQRAGQTLVTLLVDSTILALSGL